MLTAEEKFDLKRNLSRYEDHIAHIYLDGMIFNLDLTRLRALWPNLNAAVSKRNWKRAAEESRRSPPVSDTRNQYVKELFERASEQAR